MTKPPGDAKAVPGAAPGTPPPEAPEPRGGGLGGIFANVRRTAKEDPFAGLEYDRKLVVSCKACGAPQERALDFRCIYCRSEMLTEPKEPGT